MARFSGWGGLSALFDTRTDTYERERETLQSLVDEAAYKRALQSTANAHYTQPTIARLLWQSLQSLGLAEGARVVEPGCGVGTFIGTAPENTRMVGVEIDPTPATIAAKLYPNADIRAQSYTDTDLDEHGYFDAAIGNVPFGSFRPYDPVYNPGGHTIHNYFISKALAQVRPGGIVAVLTSRYTMDAKNPGVRRELYARADLVGAIRLPSGTHQEMAGTDVVSDILIFRRREKGDEPRPFDWEYAPLLEVGEGEYPVNEYFQAHPDHVLGEWEETTNQYGAALSVKGDTAALGTKLSTALETITSQARAAGLVFTPRQERYEGEIALRPVDQEKLGRITKTEEGFERYTATGNVPVKVAKNASAQLTALLKLRDQTRALVEFESQTQENPPALNHARSSLKASYEAYVAKFGPLNSQRERWYTDKKTGEEKLSWIDVPAVRVFRTDPDAALTMAIEIFDKDTRMARPAGILERRQIGITFKPLGADSVEDALAICMAEKGRVDTEYISYLTGQPSEEVIAGLHDHTFMDPETGELVERSAYLSGNIHAKVVAAEDALETDARMSENIAALKSVMPEPLSLSDIEISPGAPWISVKDHHDFYSEVVMGWHQQRVGQVGYNPVTGAWKAVQDGYQPSAKARRIWNTERRSGTQIFEALLNHTPITVKSKTIDGEEFIDRAETAAVAQKMEAMATAFTEWVWAAGERASRLEARYNEMFNSFVPRDYTGMGEKLTLPGLAKDIVPYSHQRSGVARMIYQEAVGLFHQVGAGKTKTMIMGAMELKRLGLIHKPVIAVPANVLFQFASEFQQTYPAARVLTATPDDLTKSGRREFVAKVATNDWDSVVMTREQFKALGCSNKTQAEYIEARIGELEDAIKASDSSSTIQDMTNQMRSLEGALKKALDHPTDPGISFEETGIDYIIADEAHRYKNLQIITKLEGVGAGKGNEYTADLDMKLHYLRSKNPGGRICTLATATPISNSLAEAHTMMRYLAPSVLKDAGIEPFDAFAATFTRSERKAEISPSGGFRMRTRISRFHNLPEFLSLWGIAADVKTSAELSLNIPLLAPNADGERAPQIVSIDGGEHMRAFMDDIARRADRIAAGSSGNDNMLALSTDGRLGALDLRLRGRTPIDHPVSEVAARNIYRIWEENKDNRYSGIDGAESAIPGALQLVFCDYDTPKDTWNTYDALRQELYELGLPEGSVRFIHEAKNNPEKEELFRDCREGRVAVLIGSTQKMGTGTNVQKRCIATHHLDVPWRPTDITQRDGRMVRQGNENPEVYNYRYVVTGSFSAYMWQTNERKARSIAQIMTNKTGTRSVEDVSPEEMEAGRAKAIATGNPLLLEKCEVDATLQKYRALHSSWQRTRNRAIDDTRTLDLRIRASGKTIATLEGLQGYIRDTSGDRFSIRIEQGVFTERAAAAQALSRAVSVRISPYIIENVRRTGGTYSVPQGVRIELGGIELDVARVEADSRMGVVSDVSIIFTPVDLKDVRYGPRAGIPLSILQRGQSGLIQRLENLVASLPQRLDEEKENLAFLREEAQSARELSTKEFPHEAEYAAVRTRSKEITLALEDQGDAKAHREQEARFREGIKYEEHEGFFEGLATWPRIPLPPKPTPIDAIDNWEALPTVARYESREYTWEVLGIVAGNQNGQALTRLTSNAQTHLFVADLLELEAMADPLTHAPGTVAQPLVHRTPLTPPEDAERGEHSAVDERAENEERDTGDDAAVSGESTTPAVGTGTADVATHTGEEQSVDVMRPSIPTLYDGIERTALTEAAPGVFIAKYGEQVVTFLDEARNQQVGVPYQRLFPEPGEPALYAYPDLDIAQTGNLAGSGQVARALLLDSRQDAAYLDEYAPGWRADVDEPDVPDVRDLDTADTDDVSSEESVNVRYVPPIYKGETPERVEVLAPGIETATYESAGTIVFLDPEVDALLPSRYRASLFAYPGSETSAAYREDRPREAHLRGAAQLVRALFLGSREDARYCHQVDPTWNDDASEVRAQYRAYCAANYERQAAAPIFTAVSRAVNAARTAGARGASDPREHSDALM
ncbi:helicase-related protein [Actinotignum sp. GS-2025a]|uniref:helicase-related protein n=1 Tax=Actinotignum sp. GS-2025a TaxID=3427274 RepID=UPI003F473854